jgi:hypothetical protein
LSAAAISILLAAPRDTQLLIDKYRVPYLKVAEKKIMIPDYLEKEFPFTVKICEKFRHAKSDRRSGTKAVVRFFLCPVSVFRTRLPLPEKSGHLPEAEVCFWIRFFRFCAAFLSTYFVYYQC